MTHEERLAKQRAANKRSYEKHRAKRLEEHKQWRAANADRMRELNAKWYRENRERAVAARRAWTARHPDYHRTWRLVRAGCPPEQYEQFLKEQGGVCAICRRETKVFHIDHDHATGKVRGLLCVRCNGLLGFVNDSTDILQAAIRYLTPP